MDWESLSAIQNEYLLDSDSACLRLGDESLAKNVVGPDGSMKVLAFWGAPPEPEKSILNPQRAAPPQSLQTTININHNHCKLIVAFAFTSLSYFIQIYCTHAVRWKRTSLCQIELGCAFETMSFSSGHSHTHDFCWTTCCKPSTVIQHEP